MDYTDTLLRRVMFVATAVLFLYGLTKGYDEIELIIYNTYFIALITYLIKTSFLEKGH